MEDQASSVQRGAEAQDGAELHVRASARCAEQSQESSPGGGGREDRGEEGEGEGRGLV